MSSDLTLSGFILADDQDEENGRYLPKLTSKEKTVLTYASKGLTQAEIAAREHRSPHTISKQWTSVIAKFNAANMCQAVYNACKLGLLTILCGIFPMFIPSEAGANTLNPQHIEQNRPSRRAGRAARKCSRRESSDLFDCPEITNIEGKNIHVVESSRKTLFVPPPPS